MKNEMRMGYCIRYYYIAKWGEFIYSVLDPEYLLSRFYGPGMDLLH